MLPVGRDARARADAAGAEGPQRRSPYRFSMQLRASRPPPGSVAVIALFFPGVGNPAGRGVGFHGRAGRPDSYLWIAGRRARHRGHWRESSSGETVFGRARARGGSRGLLRAQGALRTLPRRHRPLRCEDSGQIAWMPHGCFRRTHEPPSASARPSALGHLGVARRLAGQPPRGHGSLLPPQMTIFLDSAAEGIRNGIALLQQVRGLDPQMEIDSGSATGAGASTSAREHRGGSGVAWPRAPAVRPPRPRRGDPRGPRAPVLRELPRLDPLADVRAGVRTASSARFCARMHEGRPGERAARREAVEAQMAADVDAQDPVAHGGDSVCSAVVPYGQIVTGKGEDRRTASSAKRCRAAASTSHAAPRAARACRAGSSSPWSCSPLARSGTSRRSGSGTGRRPRRPRAPERGGREAPREFKQRIDERTSGSPTPPRRSARRSVRGRGEARNAEIETMAPTWSRTSSPTAPSRRRSRRARAEARGPAPGPLRHDARTRGARAERIRGAAGRRAPAGASDGADAARETNRPRTRRTS